MVAIIGDSRAGGTHHSHSKSHILGDKADTIVFLDDRPHFEVLGSKYRNNDPESEEETWIPTKL
jgi:hypothetical protein